MWHLLNRVLLLPWDPVQQGVCQDGLQDLRQRRTLPAGQGEDLLTGASEDALHTRHAQCCLPNNTLYVSEESTSNRLEGSAESGSWCAL